MKVVKLDEAGVTSSLLGMGLSYGKTAKLAQSIFETFIRYPHLSLSDFTYSDTHITLDNYIINETKERASKLVHLGNGHNEFLKFIQTWWLIEAPDYFWTQMDQYSFVVDLSTSTMHTILKRDLTQSDFEHLIPEIYLEQLNRDRLEVKNGTMELDKFVSRIPRGYLYTRVVHMNYMCLQNIVNQRKGHKLLQWKMFIEAVKKQVEHSEWIFREE